jgi:hypothetical protein
LKALAAERKRYEGRSPEWDEFLKKRRQGFEEIVRTSEVTLEDGPSWPTLGTYIRQRNGEELPPHKEFLKTFTYGQWREYSALAHGAFEGLMAVGAFYVLDSVPHEKRPQIEALYPRFRSLHIGRASAVLTSIVTELQAHCRFQGANINKRIQKVWNALIPMFEISELYDQRYSVLMKERGILA